MALCVRFTSNEKGKIAILFWRLGDSSADSKRRWIPKTVHVHLTGHESLVAEAGASRFRRR